MKAKHWQVFLFLFLVPEVLLRIPSILSAALHLIPFWDAFSALGFILILYSWIYTLANKLAKKLPVDQIDLTRFNIFLSISLLVITIVLFAGNYDSDSVRIPIYMIQILGVIFFAGYWYCLYTVAKAYKSVVKRKPVKMGLLDAEVFMFFFWPITIWSFQPIINKIFAED